MNKDYLSGETHPGFTPEQGLSFFTKPLDLSTDTIEIFKNMKFLVHDNQSIDADGLLGVDFLKRVILHINFKKNDVAIFVNS